MQIADQVERQVYQTELLAFRRLYNIHRVWVRPNADGYVYIRLTSSLKKHTFYNLLINNILYLCVT